MGEPLTIEVIAHVLGSMDHCKHCQVFLDATGVGGRVHQQDLDSYPPEWKEAWRELSDLIYRLTAKYPGHLVIKIIDAQSLQGLWAAIRHGVRKYPTFIVGGERYTGLEMAGVEALLKPHLRARATS